MPRLIGRDLVATPAVWGLAALLLLGLWALPMGAQDPEPESSEDAAASQEESLSDGEAMDGGDDLLGLGGEPGTPDIDEILLGDEAVLEGGGYTYDPGDRRDPFKSLLATRDNDERQGPRPEGVPGMLIDEITISGIFRTAQGWVAQVRASNNDKSYLIKVDDQLYDGDVISISKNEVVFKQIVQDPTALKPFREITKKLNP